MIMKSMCSSANASCQIPSVDNNYVIYLQLCSFTAQYHSFETNVSCQFVIDVGTVTNSNPSTSID